MRRILKAKTFKHINEEQRKAICFGISHNMKLYQIADIIEIDPKSVSREIKRNNVLFYIILSHNILII